MKRARSSSEQINKTEILRFLMNTLDVNLSNKVLVDITFDKDKNELIALGRSPVLGSARKQMRHVTPYSFIEQMLKSQLKNLFSAEILMEKFSEKLQLFVIKEYGICFSKEEYKQLNLETKHIKMSTNKKNIYYLFELSKEQMNTINLNDEQKERAIKDYRNKKLKFIKYSIEDLKNEIKDENTFGIACEALVRFILTLYNQKLYSAFPDEGNTIRYEIRLYNSISDATDTKIEPSILTHYEINSLIKSLIETEGEDFISLNRRIRTVDNEGSEVKRVIKALTLINTILLCDLKEEDKCIEDIQTYNNTLDFNLTIHNTFIDLSPYNHELDFSNLKELLPCHIAKHLYCVFDFKPLELEVFVPKLSNDPSKSYVEVFTSATGKKTAKYFLKNGEQYRLDQQNCSRGYNDEVVFRQKVKDDLKLLAKKVVDHLNIAVITFTELNNKELKILESFSRLVAADYAIDKDVFFDMISQQNYWADLEQGALGSDSSDSEIEEVVVLYAPELPDMEMTGATIT